MTLNERRLNLLVLMQVYPSNAEQLRKTLIELEHLAELRTYGSAEQRKEAEIQLKELGVDDR